MQIRPLLSIYLIFFYCHAVFATPWFTGPLLAPAGKTIPYGHADFELYGYSTSNIGRFHRHGNLGRSPNSKTYQLSPLFSYGLSDRMDAQFNLPYLINQKGNTRSRYIGDMFALLGYQVLTQGDSAWKPNLRVTLREIVPTGRFNRLNPANQGTDGTGSGSYQSSLGLNFQLLTQLNDVNYLRTRLVLSYAYLAPVQVKGLSTYGGDPTTNGSINPGNLTSIDLAGELTLTEHWVAVMEGYFFYHDAIKFHGFPGKTVNGKAPHLSHPDGYEFSLAPAIEYNFNSHIGIIGGIWFAVRGKEVDDFSSVMIAVNAYW